jgi:Ca2+-binding RTX toxin-like protein
VLPAAGTAAFPGTNGRLLFVQERSAFQRSAPPLADLCSTDVLGTRPTMVAESPDGQAIAHPAVAPEGARVAYSRGGSIYVAGPDGTGERFLVAGTMPAWTPNGQRVYYVASDDIRSVRDDGSLGVPFATTSRVETAPAVSPDGRSVAFVRGLSSAGEELVVKDVATGAERILVASPGVGAPAWSPDGTLIAFALGSALHTIALEGGELRTIPGGGGDPAWSPDGNLIAFQRQEDIWTYAVDTSDLVNITRSPASEGQPAWQTGTAFRMAGTSRPCAVVGTEGPDELFGSEHGDVFYDLGGDDTIRGFGGDDVVYDGAGLDRIEAGDGADLVLLSSGTNTVLAGPGDDFVNGISGFYQQESPVPPQVIYGEDGADLLTGGFGADRIEGGPGKDRINGNKGPDLLFGGPDADYLAGNRGDDSLQGNQGDDVLYGGLTSGHPLDYDGYDLLVGGEGNDRLAGGWQKDRLFGGPGGDRLAGGPNADHLVGEAGVDFFLGDGGDDLLLAGDHRREQVWGGAGFDRARLDAADRRFGVERTIR